MMDIKIRGHPVPHDVEHIFRRCTNFIGIAPDVQSATWRCRLEWDRELLNDQIDALDDRVVLASSDVLDLVFSRDPQTDFGNQIDLRNVNWLVHLCIPVYAGQLPNGLFRN